MSGYDVTQHLDYKVASGSSLASAGPPLERLRLQALDSDSVSRPSSSAAELEAVGAALAARRGAIRLGQRLTVPAGTSADLFYAVTECHPPQGGRFDAEATALAIDAGRLPVLRRCHVLPFRDAQPPNRNLTIADYVRPFFEAHSSTLVAKGFEFAHAGCRFQAVGCEPDGPAAVGPDTEVFWQGPPLERRLLKKVAVLPYAHTLPPGAKPDLFKEYVQPYFEQKSAALRPGDEFETRGVRFRVVKCEPPGAGPGKDTDVHTQGPALIECAVAECSGLATQRCSQEGCGKTICTKHATAASQTQGAEAKMLCPEHTPSQCAVM